MSDSFLRLNGPFKGAPGTKPSKIGSNPFDLLDHQSRQEPFDTFPIGQTQRKSLLGPDTRYSLYTEAKGNLTELTLRYFPGATIYTAAGIWRGGSEPAVVIEILAHRHDMQRVLDLAGDIRVVNGQDTVIVTWESVSRFDVNEESINEAAL